MNKPTEPPSGVAYNQANVTIPPFSGVSGLLSGESPDNRTICLIICGRNYSAKPPRPANFAKKIPPCFAYAQSSP